MKKTLKRKMKMQMRGRGRIVFEPNFFGMSRELLVTGYRVRESSASSKGSVRDDGFRMRQERG